MAVTTMALMGMSMALMNMTAETVMVKEGTDVPLVFAQKVSSKTAKEGQMVNLKVEKNVMVDGTVVIPAGTPVTAVIENVEKQGRFGKNAVIEFSINPVMVNGQTIQLQNRQKGLKFQGGHTGNAAAASVGGAVLLGPLGLLGGYGVVGKPVAIDPGMKVKTEVASTVAVRIP